MSGVSRNYPDGTGKLLRFEYGEHDENVVTQRYPQSAYLLIDSQDRYVLDKDGFYIQSVETSPNNIYISHQRLNGFGEIKRASVSDIYFPWRTPNVNINNNKFYLNINGTDCYLEVPEGFYKPSELAEQLQTLANAENGFSTVASYPNHIYVDDGKPWVITSNAIGNFTVTPTGATISAPSSMDRAGNSKKDLNQIMNFFTQTSTGVATITGGIPSMSYTRYIDFVSTNLSKHQRLKDSLTQLNYTNIIYRLYLENELDQPLTDDTYFGSRPVDIYRQIQNPKYMMWNKNEMISAIDIKLYDDSGDLLYIPFQDWDANYIMTMLLSES